MSPADHYIERYPDVRRTLHLVDDIASAGLAADRWPLALRIARALLRALEPMRPAAGDPVVCHEVYGEVRRQLILLIAYAASSSASGASGLVVTDAALAAIIALETTDAGAVGTSDLSMAATILDGVIWS